MVASRHGRAWTSRRRCSPYPARANRARGPRPADVRGRTGSHRPPTHEAPQRLQPVVSRSEADRDRAALEFAPTRDQLAGRSPPANSHRRGPAVRDPPAAHLLRGNGARAGPARDRQVTVSGERARHARPGPRPRTRQPPPQTAPPGRGRGVAAGRRGVPPRVGPARRRPRPPPALKAEQAAHTIGRPRPRTPQGEQAGTWAWPSGPRCPVANAVRSHTPILPRRGRHPRGPRSPRQAALLPPQCPCGSTTARTLIFPHGRLRPQSAGSQAGPGRGHHGPPAARPAS